MICLLTTGVLAQGKPTNKNQESIKPCNLSNEGGGRSGDDKGYPFGVSSNDKSSKTFPSGTQPLQIIRQPKPQYTVEARNKCVEGKVKLRVTFLASGEIGRIRVIKGLGGGLTKQTIEAAKMMKFKPAMENGKPVTVTKTVSYNYTIY